MSCAWLDNINEGPFLVPFFICTTCTYGQWSEPFNHKFLFAMVSNITGATSQYDPIMLHDFTLPVQL